MRARFDRFTQADSLDSIGAINTGTRLAI